MRFGKADWRSWERGIEKEWLLTNGIGGFASSTITGGNSRRYHGLLVAALEPPAKRRLIFSQLHETVAAGSRKYKLHAFSTGDYVERGFDYLQSFEMDPLPVFTYCMGDILIKKTVTMVHGENTVAVVYHIKSGSEGLTMKIAPLVNFRDYHGDSRRYGMRFRQEPFAGGTRIRPFDEDLHIVLECAGAEYKPEDDCWFEHMFYDVERERGLNAYEDHYIPGIFEIRAAAGSESCFTFICTVADAVRPWDERRPEDGIYCGAMCEDGNLLIAAEKKRIEELTARAGYEDEFACALVRAADNFIVYRRSTGAKTILAGYPWFTDWGRDAMISLCGLTLTTRRFDDAALILETFGEYVNYGLLPNSFPDEGGEPGYNTVDAALWYFEAVNKYVAYTGDNGLLEKKLYRSLEQIIAAYMKGTLNNIRMDADGLISAGDESTQLTWMDAKAGSTAFTPRHGKAVEINALWYNALRIMEAFTIKRGMDARAYSSLAATVKKNFKKEFWYEEGKYLYDVVCGGFRDSSLRPNQIFAVSLSYPVLEGWEARCCVEKVWKTLYTSYGLRSLSPSAPQYNGRCTGDQYARDSAYHQGTVWVWLLGHFITAFAATFGKEPGYGGMIKEFLDPFRDHLCDACIGNISEIFDGDEPQLPRGCPAQAWSVAEILRAYAEHILHGRK